MPKNGKRNGNYTPESTKANIERYKKEVAEEETEYLSSLPNPELIYKRNCFFGLIHRIGAHVFTAKKVQLNNRKCVIDYSNLDELEAVFEIYLDLCGKYGIEATKYAFLLFANIERQTFLDWSNGINVPWMETGHAKQDWIVFTKKVSAVSEMSLSNSMLQGNLMAYAQLKCWYGWKEEQTAPVLTAANIPKLTKEEVMELSDSESVRDGKTETVIDV